MAVAFSYLQALSTPLVGRDAELEEIIERLTHGSSRLLSLTGPAGVGKTRLALEVRDRLADHFPGRVVMVDLTPIRSSSLVVPAITQALGLADLGARPPLERLQEYLREREALLILDNFEHVLPAAGELSELLAAAPPLKFLITSRVPLHLRWEQTLRLAPLSVPALDTSVPLAHLLHVPSVALFVERAQAQRADFTPTEQHRPLLAQLVRQLDGLPLAIELAAAQMQALPLAVIARRLDQQVKTLKWDAHDLPPRQRSLQAAIGWSYDLLSEVEQRLFRHLGVFVGRVALDAIATVIGEADADQTLAGLVSLAEKSLVLPAHLDDEDPEPAFGMLESVRQYACERLIQEDELDAAGSAHARYFLELAERAAPELTRLQQRVWYLHLETEHDNLRAALRWFLDHDEYEPALRLTRALGWFWLTRGYHTEAWHWLGEILTRTTAADPAYRTPVLLIAGLILNDRAAYDQAKAVLEEAMTLAQEMQDERLFAEALTYLGGWAILTGDLPGGTNLLQEAVAAWDSIEAAGASYQIGLAYGYLAAAAFRRHDVEGAAALLTRTLEHHEASGDKHSASATCFYLATLLGELGDLPRGVQMVREGLLASRPFQDRLLLSLGVEATLFLTAGSIERTQEARLLGAEDALHEVLGLTAGVMARSLVPKLALVRERLQVRGLDGAFQEGRSLTSEEISDLALSVLENLLQPPPHPVRGEKERIPESSLSEREQQVLRLVAEGLTSKQIGDRLFLSPRTIDHHLTSIFNKLGVDNRAQAVAIATRDTLM
jgi:predicted ATPase/DNA-binding CsgD family transcriptional regulator